MRLFYAENLQAGVSQVQLDDVDTRHMAKSLRLGPGDQVKLTNGKGSIAVGTIVSHDKRSTLLQVSDIEQVPRTWTIDITIAVAPTKNLDRLEWFVEKATEIGINRIIPIACGNSERKNLKTDRLNRIAISAMKQSQQAWLPQIDPLTDLNQVLDQMDADKKYIAHCIADDEKQLISTSKASSVLLLIGPEGDFTAAEITAALSKGYAPVTLGANRLRTETAAFVALVSVHAQL